MKSRHNFKIVICMAIIAMQIAAASQSKETAKTKQAETFLAYVKLDKEHPKNQLRLLIDDVLLIGGNDTAALKKYGIDPEDVNNDYAMYNESEKWVAVTTTPKTTFKIIHFDNSNMRHLKLDLNAFKKYMQNRENGILATVTVAGGNIFSIEEYYVP